MSDVTVIVTSVFIIMAILVQLPSLTFGNQNLHR